MSNKKLAERQQPRFFDLEPITFENRSEIESQILDAARRGFVKYGSSRMSVRDIADLAGVSRGSVYKYFDDRDSLTSAVLGIAVECLIEDMDQAMIRFSTIDDQVVAAVLIVQSWRKAERDAQLFALSYEATLLTTQESVRFLGPMVSLMERYLVEACERGEVRLDLNVSSAAEWIIRIVVSLSEIPGYTFNDDRPDETRQFIQNHLLNGLGERYQSQSKSKSRMSKAR
ncbi:MAG TPA: TetR/AcrR family transcriptional regulator [Acidimicrobiales bacterium]|jgi:AcrR family transcriptional regulator|nr:TetR/AcrR family transcriptional regulator [Acidimicrobiales bacterium]